MQLQVNEGYFNISYKKEFHEGTIWNKIANNCMLKA